MDNINEAPVVAAATKVVAGLSKAGAKAAAKGGKVAAKAGAKYVSPFVGRVDDNSFGGLCLVKEIASIFTKQNVFDTEILAASVRGVRQVGRAFEYGAHIVTIPPSVFDKMYKHVLTDAGLDQFDKDWAGVQENINYVPMHHPV